MKKYKATRKNNISHTHKRVGRPQGALSCPTTIAEPKRRKKDLFLPGKSIGNKRLTTQPMKSHYKLSNTQWTLFAIDCPTSLSPL